MKVLLATETYHPNINGAAVFTRRLAQALVKAGHQVVVIAPALRFGRSVENEGGVTVHRVPSIPILLHPDYRLPMPDESQITGVIGIFQPDIIHIQNHFTIGNAVLHIAARLGLPVIGTNHFMPEGMLHYLLPQMVENLVKPFTWRQCIGTLNKLDYVTTPTSAAMSVLLEHDLKTPGEPVSNGIDLQTFRPDLNGDSLKNRFALPDKPTVLYTGRLEQEKRMDVWVSAIPHVLNKIDAHFVIGGKGKEEKHLFRLADSLEVADHVTFIGFLSEAELPEVYHTAQVFAMASPVELQSIVTLEAAASGLPVVAADALALPELVEDGTNGFLFPAGDAEAMGDKIAILLRDPERARAMGRRSRQVAERHSISQVVDHFVTIYKRVATSATRRNELVA